MSGSITENIIESSMTRYEMLVTHLTSHATITGKVISLSSNCPLCAQFGGSQ